MRKSLFWLFLLFLPVLTFLYGTMLWGVSLLYFPHDKDALYTLSPAKGAWYFVGIVLALGTVSFYLNSIYRHHLKRSYSSFYLQGNLPKNIEAYPAIKKLSLFLCTLAAAFILLLYDHYLVVNRSSLVVNDFIGLGKKVYPFHEVKAIRYIQNGNGASTGDADARYMILFKDGNVFDEKDNMLQDLEAVISPIRANGIRIDTVAEIDQD